MANWARSHGATAPRATSPRSPLARVHPHASTFSDRPRETGLSEESVPVRLARTAVRSCRRLPPAVCRKACRSQSLEASSASLVTARRTACHRLGVAPALGPHPSRDECGWRGRVRRVAQSSGSGLLCGAALAGVARMARTDDCTNCLLALFSFPAAVSNASRRARHACPPRLSSSRCVALPAARAAVGLRRRRGRSAGVHLRLVQRCYRLRHSGRVLRRHQRRGLGGKHWLGLRCCWDGGGLLCRGLVSRRCV